MEREEVKESGKKAAYKSVIREQREEMNMLAEELADTESELFGWKVLAKTTGSIVFVIATGKVIDWIFKRA